MNVEDLKSKYASSTRMDKIYELIENAYVDWNNGGDVDYCEMPFGLTRNEIEELECNGYYVGCMDYVYWDDPEEDM